MITTPQLQKMTVDAYLAWEPCQEFRFDYYSYQAGDTIKLESIGFEFPIALLYEAVSFGN